MILRDFQVQWVILVWDWKTGDLVSVLWIRQSSFLTSPPQVLELSSMDDSQSVRRSTKVTFLDEFRLMVLTPDYNGLAELVLFNTLLPQDHPRNLRRFRIPPRYRKQFPFVITDHDRSFGTQDGSLITDPAQSILVVGVCDSEEPHHFYLVLRTQALITRACSMSSDTCIPWDEWERDAVIMEMPAHDSHILLQGVHVIAVKRRAHIGEDTGHLRFCIFDFSLRGCSTLWNKGGRARSRRTDFYEGGRDLILEGTGRVSDRGLNSLGNGAFYSLVSCTCRRKTQAYGVLIPSLDQYYFGNRIEGLGADLRRTFTVFNHSCIVQEKKPGPHCGGGR